LRYEYLLAVKLSDKPAESVIPLARIGAKRVIHYLKQTLDKDKTLTDLKDSDWLLDGLIKGHSGKGHENILHNNKLVAKEGKQKLTVEGALGCSAMRLIDYPHGAIYYHPDKTTFNKKHSFSLKGKPKYGPKYGFMYVDDSTKQRYGFNTQFDAALQKQYSYMPQVYRADAMDVTNYLKEKQTNESFHAYLARIHRRDIGEIWLERMTFRNFTLKQADFSGVNFSGCKFIGTVFDDVNMEGANFSFTTMDGVSCHQVKFNQADFSFAAFINQAEFKQTTYINANWLGADLSGLDDITAYELQLLEEKQQQLTEDMRTEFDKVYAELKRIEQDDAEQLKNLSKRADINKEEINRLAAELLEQSAQLVNSKTYQAYCKIELQTLHENDKLYQKIITSLEEMSHLHQQRIHHLETEVTKMGEQIQQVQERRTVVKREVKAVFGCNNKSQGTLTMDLGKVNMETAITNVDDMATGERLLRDPNLDMSTTGKYLSGNDANEIEMKSKDVNIKTQSVIIDDEKTSQSTTQPVNFLLALQDIIGDDTQAGLTDEEKLDLMGLLSEQDTTMSANEIKQMIRNIAFITTKQKLYLTQKIVKLQQQNPVLPTQQTSSIYTQGPTLYKPATHTSIKPDMEPDNENVDKKQPQAPTLNRR